MLSRGTHTIRSQREHGQVAVFFALLLPALLALGAFVIGIGNWYTHAKHLQTKADAGAFAGGGSWAFPCGPEIDTRIETQARLYAGSNNPQVGGVPNADVHTVLNGSAWYDDDSNNAPLEKNDPPNPSICAANILDVKVTEDNSFPLASLIPLFPDIKRKARVQIEEAEGITGLLPIAVRAPVPDSMAAVFYNQQTGNILGVEYFVQNAGVPGLPAGLQGWSTLNTEDMAGSWASFAPPAATSVAIAISFRGACNTNLPNGNTQIKTSAAPCFEDEGFTTVNQLCNQGSAVQIVNCYYSNTGSWPNENIASGLQFIRGYSTPSVTNAPPQLQDAWLENQGDCLVNGTVGTGYFNAHPSNTCHARLRVVVDTGDVQEDPPGNPAQVVQTRVASNVEVKWGTVDSQGNVTCDFGNNCELQPSSPNASGDVTYSTTGGNPYQNLTLAAGSRANAVAIQIRVKGSTVNPNPGNCGPGLNNFNNNCRWFHVGTGVSSTSVDPLTNNGGAAARAAPVQQAFRGLSTYSSSVQWLRLTQSSGCNQLPDLTDPLAAAARAGNRCFFLDLGLKGGIAVNAHDQPILFNDGTGSSQMGALDCDPNIPQGQILIDGIIRGCGPWYARHLFDVTPLCPSQNSIFNLPNPGPPWTNWPPLRCIKTRPTGSMNQMERGLKGRFFGNQNTNQCPGGANGGPQYIKGRNYWDMHTTNGYTGTPPYGYKDGTHDTNFNTGDPRIVTIFLTTTEGFTGSGQNTYPITGFIQVYITGFGRINGNGSLGIDDPCPGSTPPQDLDLGGGNGSGYAVWGHILNWVIPAPGATPSGRICNPGRSAQPCVAVLVE